mgnify:FL=1
MLVHVCLYRWKAFLKMEADGEAAAGSSRSIMERFTAVKYKPEHHAKRKLVHSVAMNLVVDCDMPLNIVTRPGFIQHHAVLNNCYDTIDK